MGRKHVLGDGDDEIRNHKGSRESQAQNSGQGLDDANAASGGEGEGEEGHQQEGQGDGCRDDSEGEVHGSIVAGADVGIGYQIRRISPQRTRLRCSGAGEGSTLWLCGNLRETGRHAGESIIAARCLDAEQADEQVLDDSGGGAGRGAGFDRDHVACAPLIGR